MSAPSIKCYNYDEADAKKLTTLLENQEQRWRDSIKKRYCEDNSQLVQRVYDELEVILIDAVNSSVPFKFKSSKKTNPIFTLEDKQEYLKKLLENPSDDDWDQAFAFIKDEIKNKKPIQRLTTKEGKKLKSLEEIAIHFNIIWSAKTIDSSKLVEVVVTKPEKVHEFKLDSEVIEEKAKQMALNKSHGSFEITNEMLRLAAPGIAPYLKKLFNLCLQLKDLPDAWLHSRVIPAYKGKGDRESEDSYRPISLAPALGRLLEHLVSEYLCELLNDLSLLHPRQHGHRKGFSNLSQLACFLEERSLFTRFGSQVDCIKVDLKAATNFVSHRLLTDKLKNLPIDKKVYNYIKRYMKNHTQAVKVGSHLSPLLRLQQGLPQGSPLTNPLFLIYINEVFKALKNRSRIRAFGDDLLVYREVKNKDDQYALQEDVYCLQEFLKGHGLEANHKKIQAITFYNPQKFDSKEQQLLLRDYIMYDKNICRVEHIEYLGHTLSHDMTSYKHVNTLIEKYEPQLDYYMELIKLCPREAKSRIYKSMMRPKLEMCSPIWNLRNNYSHDALMANLERLQQKCAAFVLDKEFESISWHPSWKANREELGWESLHARRIFASLNLVQKIAERELSLKELVHLEKKQVKEGTYEEMKADMSSIVMRGKSQWRRMLAYFEENPNSSLSVERRCLETKEVFCKYAANKYEEHRAAWLQNLKKSSAENILQVAKANPYGLHHMLDE